MGGWRKEHRFDGRLVMLGTIGPSEVGILIVIVVLYTPIVARVVRSATLNIRG